MVHQLVVHVRPLGSLCLLRDGEEQLELWREFLLGVQTIAEVHAPDAAVGVHLHSQGLDVVRSVSAPSEVGQVELDLIPAFVQSHGHRANKGFHTCGRLVVARTETPAHVLVVKHLDLEREVLLQILDDHHEERQLDAKGLVCIGRA